MDQNGSPATSLRDAEVGGDRGILAHGASLLATSFTQHLSEHVEDEEVKADIQVERTGTILSSWSVMANTILGVGMLALPWAAAQIGWIFACGLLVVAGSFALLSLMLLSKIALHVGEKDTTFYSVCVKYAPGARLLVDFAISVKCFGVCTSYLQICAQNVMSLVRPHPDYELIVRASTVAITLLSAVPVAYRRRIGNTKLTNWLSLGCILYVWLLLVVLCFPMVLGNSPHEEPTPVETDLLPVSYINVMTTVPVFIFSFTCHQNMFSVANEIKEPNFKRLSTTAGSAVSTAVVLYAVCIALGYAAFGKSVKNNILLSLPQGIPTQLGSLLMAVSNAFSICLQIHPCRRSMMILFNWLAGVNYQYPQRGERLLRRFLTTFILLGTGALATAVSDLGIVFEIVGAVGSNTICYIMPAFLYIKAFRGEPSSSRLFYGLAILQLSIGCIVLPTSLFAIFYQATH